MPLWFRYQSLVVLLALAPLAKGQQAGLHPFFLGERAGLDDAVPRAERVGPAGGFRPVSLNQDARPIEEQERDRRRAAAFAGNIAMVPERRIKREEPESRATGDAD